MSSSVKIMEQFFSLSLFFFRSGYILVHLMRNSGCKIIKFVLGTGAGKASKIPFD